MQTLGSIDEDGRAVSYAYNTAKGTLSSVTNQKGNVTSYTYNTDNDLLTGVSSGGATVNYTYNSSNDRLTSITHNGFNYNFAYDVFGNTSSVKVGSQTLASYSYRSANGKLQSVTYGNGLVKSYGYSGNLGLMDTLNYNGVQKFTWLYKSDGTPLKYKDNISNREETYVYDSTKRLIRQNSTVRYDRSKSLHTMEYGYDLMNNVSRLVNSANGVTVIPTYTYGKDNMITRHDMNTLRRHTYTYDTLNRLTNMTMNSTAPVSLDYTYTSSARNTGGGTLYTTSKLRTEVIGDTAYLYTYDNAGNILTISETTRANKDNDSAYVLKQSYEYDALDRLTRENDVKTGFTILYNYDAGGNISKKNYYFYTSIPTEGLSSPALVINYVFDTLWKDKLVYLEAVINGVVTETADIVYDNIGNPTNYLGGNLTWTGRELTSYDGNTYTYSSDGLRTSKTLVNGQKTEYYYSGSSLVFEHRDLTYNGQPDGMSLFYTYDDAGRLSNIRYIIDSIGYEHNYYPVCNSRGDVEAIYDYHGTLMAKYTYDAWGDAVSIKDAQGHEIYDPMHIGKLNPFRYRGYYYDAETDLYYLRSRYYSTLLGRFINADSQLNPGTGLTGTNLFAYANNNPVKYSDPDGHLPLFAITAAIGAVVGAVAGGIIAAKTGNNVWAGIGIGAAGGALLGCGVGAGLGMISGAGAAATAGQVGAGLATLATAAGDKIAAGVNKISNAISSIGNKASPAVNKMADVAAKGKAGEAAANIVKNTAQIPSLSGTAAYRIPDGLDTTMKILSEVKNYSGTLSYTSQLRDFVSWSGVNGYQMHLYTNAHLSGPLQQAVDSGLIQLFPLG